MSGISSNELKILIEAFDRSDWQELTFEVGQDSLHVSRTPGASVPKRAVTSAPPPPEPEPHASTVQAPAVTPAPDIAPVSHSHSDGEDDGGVGSEGITINAPSVGLFWRAAAPGTPPYVEVGSTIKQGDVIGIVEVMKLMNHVTAEVAGTVTAILVENGGRVEFGQPLVRVKADGS